MKRKAILKKIEVKNTAFIEAVISSVRSREDVHKEILENAKKSGVLSRLIPSK